MFVRLAPDIHRKFNLPIRRLHTNRVVVLYLLTTSARRVNMLHCNMVCGIYEELL